MSPPSKPVIECSLTTVVGLNFTLQKSTKAIMDQFVLGKRRGRVNCEIIEADMKGASPDEDDFDENSPSLLDVIVEQNDKVLILKSVYALMCLKVCFAFIPDNSVY